MINFPEIPFPDVQRAADNYWALFVWNVSLGPVEEPRHEEPKP